jgi:hypothetical protein
MSRLGMLYVGLAVLASASAIAGADSPMLKVPKELLQQRVETARKVWEQNRLRVQSGVGLPADVFGWSEHWLDAELAVCDKQGERAKALRDHLGRTREVERITAALARAGQGRQADADAATYYRLEAEIRLFKAGVEPQPAKGSRDSPKKP